MWHNDNKDQVHIMTYMLGHFLDLLFTTACHRGDVVRVPSKQTRLFVFDPMNQTSSLVKIEPK